MVKWRSEPERKAAGDIFEEPILTSETRRETIYLVLLTDNARRLRDVQKDRDVKT